MYLSHLGLVEARHMYCFPGFSVIEFPGFSSVFGQCTVRRKVAHCHLVCDGVVTIK